MKLRSLAIMAVLLCPAILLAQTSTPAKKSSSMRSVSGGAYPIMSDAAAQRGRKVIDLFNAGETSAMWATYAPELKKRAGSEEKWTAAMKNMHEKLGKQTAVLEENKVPFMLGRATLFSRLSQFENVKVPIMFTIIVKENGEVDGFLLNPEPQPPEGHNSGYEDTAKLRLPFNGDWLVYQGGHSIFQNANMGSDDQKFSYDFVLLKDGNAFHDDATANENFYCYGQPVLAPADGTVVKVEDNIGDNPPGKPAPDKLAGNNLVISHGNKEYTLLSNLKQNSIKFKRGDTVKQGEVVGECGNSGGSSSPHIHMQFQNGAGYPIPEPLPAQFNNYIADGKPVATGEPVKGQVVSNGAAAPAPAPPATK